MAMVREYSVGLELPIFLAGILAYRAYARMEVSRARHAILLLAAGIITLSLFPLVPKPTLSLSPPVAA